MRDGATWAGGKLGLGMMDPIHSMGLPVGAQNSMGSTGMRVLDDGGGDVLHRVGGSSSILPFSSLRGRILGRERGAGTLNERTHHLDRNCDSDRDQYGGGGGGGGGSSHVASLASRPPEYHRLDVSATGSGSSIVTPWMSPWASPASSRVGSRRGSLGGVTSDDGLSGGVQIAMESVGPIERVALATGSLDVARLGRVLDSLGESPAQRARALVRGLGGGFIRRRNSMEKATEKKPTGQNDGIAVGSVRGSTSGLQTPLSESAAGVGFGVGGQIPGLAHTRLMSAALRYSRNFHS